MHGYMGTFDASLRTIGDRTGLAATLTVEKGRLMIAAGDQTIGDWSLDEIMLEQTPNGYRMAAEGEQILLDIPNVDEFDMALRGKKVRSKKGPKPDHNAAAEPESVETSESSEPPTPVASVSPKPKHARQENKAPKTEKSETGDSVKVGFMGTVDKALDTAHEKWGGLFPSWMFTRGTAYILIASLVLLLVFPAVLFYVLLLGGVLLVMLGAVLYTDSVLSARWLPGRMTPMHVLVFGVVSLVLGVVVGVAAGNLIYVIALGVVIGAGLYLATLMGARKASE